MSLARVIYIHAVSHCAQAAQEVTPSGEEPMPWSRVYGYLRCERGVETSLPALSFCAPSLLW